MRNEITLIDQIKGKKSIALEYNIKRIIDDCSNCTTNSCTKCAGTRCYFLRELKEKRIIELRWIS